MGTVLEGFTIGVTADRRWDEQASLFERRGATVLHGPTIRTLPLGSDEPLHAATVAVIERPPDVLIANTSLGIRSWFGAADSWGAGADLLTALEHAHIVVRGPKASGAIHSLGLEVHDRAPTERLGTAVDLALAHLGPGRVVAIQVDGTGTSPELDRLRASGADVVVVPVYEWHRPDDERPAVRLARALVSGKVHAVTFTTGAAVTSWLTILSDHDLSHELLDSLNDGSVVIGCVGPVCAEVAVAAGLRQEHLVVPTAFRLGPLVRLVGERLVARRLTLHLATGTIVVAGTTVTLDDGSVELSDVEARLLAVLARHPHEVFAKTELLRQVWGATNLDPHIVEVSIARLRRRLGRHGGAISSVHRRGYSLRTA